MARIIIIDDQDAIRSIVRRTLERHGHTVVEAPDGQAGMRLLLEQPVDLVITDIFMPGQDGIETLRAVRKDFPGVPVIVMSGGSRIGDLDLREAAEVLGAVRTIQKPFGAHEILKVVSEVLGQRD